MVNMNVWAVGPARRQLEGKDTEYKERQRDKTQKGEKKNQSKEWK